MVYKVLQKEGKVCVLKSTLLYKCAVWFFFCSTLEHMFEHILRSAITIPLEMQLSMDSSWIY